jgi:hypothetical protein
MKMMRRNFDGLERRLRFMPQGPSLAGGRHDHIDRANTTPYLSTDAVRKCDPEQDAADWITPCYRTWAASGQGRPSASGIQVSLQR